MIVILPAKVLKGMLNFLNFTENFDAFHPDGEKSQILSILTAQIDYQG